MPKLIPGTNVLYAPAIESTLIRIDELSPERVDAIRRAAKYQLYLTARRAYPSARLVVRDLTPQDLAETNFEWVDTSGTADAWEAHQIEDQSIADGRFVALTGCRLFLYAHATSQAISAIRIKVGGSEIARWNLYPLFGVSSATAGNTVNATPSIGMITESPIIISENISVTIDQWVLTASTAFVLALDGYTCEIEGKVLKP